MVNNSFATSSRLGEKMQVIDLSESETKLIETIQKKLNLKLEIIEYYTSVSHSSIYKLNLFLINKDFQIVDNFTYYVQIPNNRNQQQRLTTTNMIWRKVSHVFDVKKPIKYIIFYHAGQSSDLELASDSEAFNGTKMTNGSIRFFI